MFQSPFLHSPEDLKQVETHTLVVGAHRCLPHLSGGASMFYFVGNLLSRHDRDGL